MATVEPPATAAPPGEVEVRTCANCGATVATEFCGYCGQHTGPRLLSMRELLADIVEDQLSVNGTFVRTAVPLVTKPGMLTREYLQGRVVRYIPPFRLFLVCMAAWLLAVTYQVHRQQPAIERAVRERIVAEQAENARLGRPTKPVQLMKLPIDTAWLPVFARAPLRPVARRYAEINAMEPGAAVSLVVGAFLRSSTRLMLVLMPVVAGLLQLLYIRRRRLYAEHFVFTLHLHAFWFLVMGAAALLPSALPVQIASNLWLAVYTLLAMKRVYGDGWTSTFAHCVAFGALYGGLIYVLGPVANAVMLMT